MLDEAEANMRAGRFEEARMTYSYLLYKEPKNYVALRGHLMCELEIKYVSNIIAED